jgi:hypothetical protein
MRPPLSPPQGILSKNRICATTSDPTRARDSRPCNPPCPDPPPAPSPPSPCGGSDSAPSAPPASSAAPTNGSASNLVIVQTSIIRLPPTSDYSRSLKIIRHNSRDDSGLPPPTDPPTGNRKLRPSLFFLAAWATAAPWPYFVFGTANATKVATIAFSSLWASTWAKNHARAPVFERANVRKVDFVAWQRRRRVCLTLGFDAGQKSLTGACF